MRKIMVKVTAILEVIFSFLFFFGLAVLAVPAVLLLAITDRISQWAVLSGFLDEVSEESRPWLDKMIGRRK